jgi:hypothetical protein
MSLTSELFKLSLEPFFFNCDVGFNVPIATINSFVNIYCMHMLIALLLQFTFGHQLLNGASA